MTQRLLLFAAGMGLCLGLSISSHAEAAVSSRAQKKKESSAKKSVVFGRKHSKQIRRRVRDTTAVIMPEGPFQGGATVGGLPGPVKK